MRNRFLGLVAACSMFVLASSASAATTWIAILNSANENNPADTSTGTGFASISVTGNSLTIALVYSGLLAPSSAGHFHCCGPLGTNTSVVLPFAGLPAATSASYTHIFDLLDSTIYSAAFVTANGGTAAGAEAALLAAFNAGTSYVNLHNSINPGGEIRGQVTATPEPSSLLLGLLATAGFVGARSVRKARF
jgi:hypothetical protein